MATWLRCGNTPFWGMAGVGPTVYVNPVDLVSVSSPWSRSEIPGDEAAPGVVRKELVENVDLQNLPEVRRGLDEHRRHYGDHNVRVFFDWMNARAASDSREEAVSSFRKLAPREQGSVLDIISDILFNNSTIGPKPMAAYWDKRDVLIGWPGTFIYEKPAEAEEALRATEPTILAESWAAGLDEALSYFGILEC